MFADKKYKLEDHSKSDVYMRLSQLPEGDSDVRVLSEIWTGYQAWDEQDGKQFPVRIKSNQKHTADLEWRHFWVMLVWDRRDEKIKILQITQTTVQADLDGLERHKQWGDVRKYDLTIKKTGTGMDTRYNVTPCPKEAISAKIKGLYDEYMKSFEIEKFYQSKYQKEEVVEQKGDDIVADDLVF